MGREEEGKFVTGPKLTRSPSGRDQLYESQKKRREHLAEIMNKLDPSVSWTKERVREGKPSTQARERHAESFLAIHNINSTNIL